MDSALSSAHLLLPEILADIVIAEIISYSFNCLFQIKFFGRKKKSGRKNPEKKKSQKSQKSNYNTVENVLNEETRRIQTFINLYTDK